MIVKEKIYNDEDGSVGYCESIYNSSNILTSTYFPKTKILYIAFNRGSVYSYGNIDSNVYEEFKKSDSQGKFFITEIKKNPDKYPFLKEFKLFQSEIEDAKKVINEWKKNQK